MTNPELLAEGRGYGVTVLFFNSEMAMISFPFIMVSDIVDEYVSFTTER